VGINPGADGILRALASMVETKTESTISGSPRIPVKEQA
jgi:hypothetical protein